VPLQKADPWAELWSTFPAKRGSTAYPGITSQKFPGLHPGWRIEHKAHQHHRDPPLPLSFPFINQMVFHGIKSKAKALLPVHSPTCPAAYIGVFLGRSS